MAKKSSQTSISRFSQKVIVLISLFCFETFLESRLAIKETIVFLFVTLLLNGVLKHLKSMMKSNLSFMTFWCGENQSKKQLSKKHFFISEYVPKERKKCIFFCSHFKIGFYSFAGYRRVSNLAILFFNQNKLFRVFHQKVKVKLSRSGMEWNGSST